MLTSESVIKNIVKVIFLIIDVNLFIIFFAFIKELTPIHIALSFMAGANFAYVLISYMQDYLNKNKK